MKSLMVQATLLDPRLKDFFHVTLADRAHHVDFAKKELLANDVIEKICKPAAEGVLAPLSSTSVEKNEGNHEDVELPKKRLKGICLIYIIIYIIFHYSGYFWFNKIIFKMYYDISSV